MAQPLVALDNQPKGPDETLVSTRPQDNAPRLPAERARERALRAHYGLGEVSPGADALYMGIVNGRETNLRQQAANLKNVQTQQRNLRLLEQIGQSPEIGQNEIDLANGLINTPASDPSTVFEEEFGSRYITAVLANKVDSEGIFNRALLEDPEDLLDAADAATRVVVRNQIIGNKMQELEAQWQGQGWGETIGDIGGMIVPFHDRYQFGQAAEGIETESLLTGELLQEVQIFANSLPPREFKQWVDTKVDELAEDNVLRAMRFLGAVRQYSLSDASLDNMFDLLDVADVGTLGVGTAASALRTARAGRISRGVGEGAGETAAELAQRTASYQARRALRDATRAASENSAARPEDIFGAIGDVQAAARISAIRPDIGGLPSNQVDDFARNVPSLFRTERILNGPSTLTREATQRLKDGLEVFARQADEVITRPLRVQRVTNEALEVGIEQVEKALAREFRHLSDSILDVGNGRLVRVDNIEENPANIQTVSLLLGGPNATLFDTPERAIHYAEELYKLPSDYKVFQQGDWYGLQISRPIDETDSALRDANIQTRHTDVPGRNSIWAKLMSPAEGLLPNAVGGFLRSANELLPGFQNTQRLAAEFGFIESVRLMDNMTQSIRNLTKRQLGDFEKILRYNQNYYNPATQQRGMFYENFGQLEEAYMEKIGRLPTENEIAAYFKYVKFNNVDWALRNFSLYRDKARLGLNRFTFEYFDPQALEGAMRFKNVPDFEGREIDNIKQFGEDAVVAVYDPRARTFSTQTKNQMDFDELKQMQENGFRLIQIDNPISRPLKEALNGSNEIVRFVLLKNFEKKELDWKQLDYNPGGHIDYVNPWYVKQPLIYRTADGRPNYEGDITIFNFATRAQAKKFAKAMDDGRLLLKAKDEAALTAHLRRTLPYTLDQFKKLFKDELDIDNPITLTKSGTKTRDTLKLQEMYPGLRDYTSSDYDLSGEVGRKYVGVRSGPLMTIKEGSENAPLFAFEPAEILDPLPMVSRAIKQVAATRNFGDYKIGAAEDWIQKYGQLLRPSQKDVRANPMYHMSDPDWLPNADPALKAQAESARRAVINFVGQQTTLGRNIEIVVQRLQDSLYEGTGKTSIPLVSNGLGRIRDPISLVRSFAFHTKMGLFNPVQLWQQMHGMAHIIALSPRHGAEAAIAYPATRIALMRPDDVVIEHVSGLMKAVGWKPEDFQESMRGLIRTGFFRVGRETAWLDEMADPQSFKTTAMGRGWRWFLDKGLVFFREGDMTVRSSSWHAAYREWKSANPNRTFNDAAQRAVFNKADILSNNMTRASNASINRGIFSIPTQFLSYQMRLMDQFMGVRLTPAQKLRAFGVYSAFYGVPTAFGAATGFGLYQDFIQEAKRRGIDVDNNYLKAFTEGLPSILGAMIWGEDYNYAQRFGPGGFNMLWQDKTFIEMVLGPSGSIAGDMLTGGSRVLTSVVEMTKEGGSYEPIANDVLDVARNISSVNSAVAIYVGMNTGRYYSKNGTYLNDLTTQQGLFKGITGLDPLEVSEAYATIDINQAISDTHREAQKEFSLYFRQGLEAAWEGDEQKAEAFNKRARAAIIAGDIQPDMYADWVAEVLRENQNLVENVEQRFQRLNPDLQLQGNR